MHSTTETRGTNWSLAYASGMSDSVTDSYNVVFCVLDSLRTDRVSAYDETIEFTDHIGSIADDAVVFEHAVAQAPWTLPSHASMFTGEYPWEHGTTHARSYFPTGKSTFVSQFAGADYRTAAITPNIWISPHKGMTRDFEFVENFLGTADNPVSRRLSRLSTKLYDAIGTRTKRLLGRQLDRAFRLFGVDDSCKSEETIAAVESYLADRSADERFFLYVNFMEPHEPYHPPQRYLDAHGVADTSSIPHRQKDMFTMDDIDFEKLQAVYDASADYTDDLVGRLSAALAANDLDEDTVVVLLSDHGQALGERDGLFGHQFTVIEPVVNTVLLVDHPELDARREPRPIELRSLFELVPYYAGLAEEPPDVFEGPIRGGYEFPENFTGYIPADEWDEYYRRTRYLKADGTKVVKSVDEAGEARYEALDLETGESVPVPPALRTAIDSIEAADPVADADDDAGDEDDRPADADDAVADRLEALGYR
jgi:arylsulfatase A-like enzyme